MMEQRRTLMKLSVSDNCISLRTISKGFRHDHRFLLLEKELRILEENRHMVTSDIWSFVEMHLEKAGEEGDILRIEFTWLDDAGNGRVTGKIERLKVPYDRFKEGIAESRRLGGACVGLLSMKERGNPKIEFHSMENLKEVAESPVLRKKLGKFLARHFAWKRSDKIMVYDDYVPYSFFFREERGDGRGVCGGIILHGQEDLRKAYYGIHT